MNEKWKSAFDQIHAEDELKTRTKEYLSEKIYHRRAAPRPIFRRAAALAAGLLLLCFIGGSWFFMTPTAYISIDINPSLELGINRFDRVVSVESYNEDGEDLARALNITFMNYSDALDEILSSRSIEDYLSGDALMSLTVAGDNDTQYTEILDTVETCADGRENIQCHSGNTEEMHEAHDAGVSFGKYRAYLILHDLDPSISLDDIRSMTMREIYDLIDSYDGDQGTENTGTRADEAGTGTEAGTGAEAGTETETADTGYEPGSRPGEGHGQGRQHHREHGKREND